MSVITFLTDYGSSDDFVGVCHGVVARIAPDVRIIDITHGVPRHDIRTGAIMLRRAIDFMPRGVHLAVVDPGVGGSRRAVVLRCEQDGQFLVGPDNGLLAPAAERLGGIAEALDIEYSPLRLEPVRHTFHGRDIFAPLAAHLAAGTEWAEVGHEIDPGTLVALDLPQPRVSETAITAHVLMADTFGNVALNIAPEDLTTCGMAVGQTVTVNGRSALYARTFSDAAAGRLVLCEDGFGTLSVAVNRGSALKELGLSNDAEVELAPST
jgi:S-adenosyl-L-methionine hydrolase (adenosine-forming)